MSECPKCTSETPSPTTLAEARNAILESVHRLLKLDADLTVFSESLLERFRTLYPEATIDLQGSIAAAQNDGLVNAASCLIAIACDLRQTAEDDGHA